MRKSTNFLDYPKKLQRKIIIKAIKASNKEQREYVKDFTCSNCGKLIGKIGLMSPTTNKKRQNLCLDCAKKFYTYSEIDEMISGVTVGSPTIYKSKLTHTDMKLKLKDPGITYKWIYEVLRRKVRKDYGEEHDFYDEDCLTCDAYTMLHILENCVDLEKELADKECEELEKLSQ